MVEAITSGEFPTLEFYLRNAIIDKEEKTLWTIGDYIIPTMDDYLAQEREGERLFNKSGKVTWIIRQFDLPTPAFKEKKKEVKKYIIAQY